MEMLIYLYIHYTNADTVAQLDRRWLELWYGRQRLFTRLLSKKGRMGDRGTERGRNVLEKASLHLLTELCSCLISLSLSLNPTLPLLPSLSLPFTAPPTRCTFAWNKGGTHAHTERVFFVYVDLWKRQNRAEASDMHVRLPWIQHPGTPLLFFLFDSNFLTVFLLLLFSNFEYFGS